MNINIIQQKYLSRGLQSNTLKSLDDLEAVHGINASEIKGIRDLGENRIMFESFIINFYNRWGLEARDSIKPLSVKNSKNCKLEFLSFYYLINGKKEWLHVVGSGKWY